MALLTEIHTDFSLLSEHLIINLKMSGTFLPIHQFVLLLFVQKFKAVYFMQTFLIINQINENDLLFALIKTHQT